jgi:hypothetical protein
VDEYERIRRLRDEYEAALDDAGRLRDAYHREIVKLHRSGRSLREIAEGLGISHQRVHQIVSPAGASRSRRGAALRAGGAAIGVIVVLAATFVAGRSLGTSAPAEKQVGPAERTEPLVVTFTRCWTSGSGPSGRRTSSLRMAQAAGCERSLRLAGLDTAAAVLIDPRTGAIEAMVSWSGPPISLVQALDRSNASPPAAG